MVLSELESSKSLFLASLQGSDSDITCLIDRESNQVDFVLGKLYRILEFVPVEKIEKAREEKTEQVSEIPQFAILGWVAKYSPEQASLAELPRVAIQQATENEYSHWKKAQELSEQNIILVRKIAAMHCPEMKISRLCYAINLTQVIIYFTAANRVDFRQLLRELSQRLKVKILMRHISLREEARLLGGIGTDGRYSWWPEERFR